MRFKLVEAIDSIGNDLSKEQEEFFKNSKVRDSRGKLLVCYHGTPNEFDIFDNSKSLKGILEGGLYFTSNKQTGSAYDEKGRVLSVYLNITGYLDLTNYSKDYIQDVIEHIPEDQLELGDKYNIDRTSGFYFVNLANMVYKHNSWYKTACDVIEGWGYDGVKQDNETYIAFHSNQIKSISNLNPTNSNNINENLDNSLYHAYHGSKEAFDRFNYDYIGSHALENGFGLYFTTDEDIAKSYGNYIIEADLLIRKPFSNNEITITKDQVKKYIRKYVDPIGDDYLSNFGWYEDKGYENVLNKCVNGLFIYNQSDNDILSEILPEVQNKYSDEAYDAIFEIFGKDGIIYTGYSEWDGQEVTNYIVYSNNQILNKKRKFIKDN